MNRTLSNSAENRAGYGLAPPPAFVVADKPPLCRPAACVSDVEKKYHLTAGWVSGQLITAVKQAKSITLRLVVPCSLGLYLLGAIESWPAFCIGAPMTLWLGITSFCTAYRLVRIYREGEAAVCREAIVRTMHSLKRLGTAIDDQLHSLQQSRTQIHRLMPAGIEMTEQDCANTDSEQKKTRRLRACTFIDLCKKTKKIKAMCLMSETQSTVASYNDRLSTHYVGTLENKDIDKESITTRILLRRRERAFEQQKKAPHSLDKDSKDLEKSQELHRTLTNHCRILSRIKNTESLEHYQLYRKEQLKSDLSLLRGGKI